MYAVEQIRIDRFLEREEIIQEMLKADEISTKKFLIFCKLTNEEKIRFIERCGNSQSLMEWLLYYQLGVHDIFEKRACARNDEIRKVLGYGQRQNCDKGSKGE